MKDQTRKEMQQKMAEFQMAAPEVLWTEIEKAVGAQRDIVASTQEQHAVMLPMRRKRIVAAAAAIILIVGGAGFWMLRHQGQHEDQRAERIVAVSKVNKTQGFLAINEPTILLASEPATHAWAASHSYSMVSSVLPVSMEVGGMQPESNVSTDDCMLTKETTQEESGTGIPESSTHLQHSQPPMTIYPDALNNRSAMGNRLTAKIYFANSMNGYASSTSFTPMLMSAVPFGKYDDGMVNEGDSPLSGDFSEFNTNVHHHQPLRLGLSLRYNIDNRWSVESGLSYSRHKSDITNKSGDREIAIEQQLAYIGIPLNVNYRIWSSSRFNFYVSAGGMVEKMVKGSRNTQTITSGKPENNTTEDVSIHPLQLSLNCAAGAEFCIDKSFSLYAEPGLSYHFDNGSSVPTIYQDEPLSANLSIGLRFSFK